MIEIKDYPKVQNKLRTHIRALLTRWIKEAVQEEPTPITDDYLDQAIDSLIKSNFRLLYDFFDENYIYLQPHLLEQLNPEGGWGYELSFPGGIFDEDQSYNSRREAEDAGFIECFKRLEELL